MSHCDFTGLQSITPAVNLPALVGRSRVSAMKQVPIAFWSDFASRLNQGSDNVVQGIRAAPVRVPEALSITVASHRSVALKVQCKRMTAGCARLGQQDACETSDPGAIPRNFCQNVGNVSFVGETHVRRRDANADIERCRRARIVSRINAFPSLPTLCKLACVPPPVSALKVFGPGFAGKHDVSIHGEPAPGQCYAHWRAGRPAQEQFARRPRARHRHCRQVVRWNSLQSSRLVRQLHQLETQFPDPLRLRHGLQVVRQLPKYTRFHIADKKAVRKTSRVGSCKLHPSCRHFGAVERVHSTVVAMISFSMSVQYRLAHSRASVLVTLGLPMRFVASES